MTLGCLGYLATLSLPMFLVAASAVVLGTIAQYVARGYGMAGFEAAREEEDLLQKHYRGMAEGARSCASTARAGSACTGDCWTRPWSASAACKCVR